MIQSLRMLTTFQKAIAVSLVLHAGLLTVRFVDPTALDRIFQPPILEVVMLNAQGQSKPVKSQLLAQTSMEGGGNVLAGHATEALLVDAAAQGLEFQNQAASSSIETLREQQNVLLAQVRDQLTALQNSAESSVDPGNATQHEERQRRLAQQIAALEKDVATENARPRKRFFSPTTREAVFAVYFSELRRAIEKQGTLDFPQRDGEKIFGELTMAITVDAAGRVVATSMARSSGDAMLDHHAENIVRRAAPYGPFSAAIRATADQLVFVARFRFVQNEDRTEALVD